MPFCPTEACETCDCCLEVACRRGCHEAEMDVDARLTPPPIDWRPMRVKLRRTGRAPARIRTEED